MTLYGERNSLYSLIVTEPTEGRFRAVLKRGDKTIYSTEKTYRNEEKACASVIDAYIKEGFASYLEYNSLVDDFMGEPQSKRNYWKEYRAKIKADELEKIKEIANNDFCTGYYRKILD